MSVFLLFIYLIICLVFAAVLVYKFLTEFLYRDSFRVDYDLFISIYQGLFQEKKLLPFLKQD